MTLFAVNEVIVMRSNLEDELLSKFEGDVAKNGDFQLAQGQSSACGVPSPSDRD